MNNEQNGASAGTIDTPEFLALAEKFAHESGCEEFNKAKYDSARAALITYIMDWHSAGVAAEKRDFGLLKLAYVQLQARLASCETALAAAREQAYGVAQAACEQNLGNGGMEFDEGINACSNAIDMLRQSAKNELSVDRDAPLRGAPAATDGLCSAVPAELPEGFVVAPHYRGYANLGTGNYLVNHSAAGEPAELVISVATDEQKAGRAVGDEQDNVPGEYIQPDIMCVRIRFENAAGLDVLENQLRYLRNVHFAAAAAPVAQAPVAQDGYVMVPKEPTPEMLRAGREYTVLRYSYRAMLAAAPVAAPTQVAAPVLTDADMDRLHNAIMNLPCKQYAIDKGLDLAYKTGHRDARHAAAELVAATQAERQPQPADSLESLMIEHRAGITPEYEGGYQADLYGEFEKSQARAFGNTPREALDRAIVLGKHLSTIEQDQQAAAPTQQGERSDG